MKVKSKQYFEKSGTTYQMTRCYSPKDFYFEHRCYRRTDMSLARPTSRGILFDGGNIYFDASLVIYK